VVGLRAHPTKILTPTSFVADNLTSSTTGVPSGTSLSTLGATTYTSANNGQSITAKQFTARVTLNGVTGMTFTNCLFQCATDYYCCILDSSCSGNTFNYCSFDGANGTFDTGRFPFKGTGATLFRCYSTGADNGGRFDSDCTMQECLVENLIHITDGSGNGSHNDGWEVSGPGNNINFIDSKLAAENGSVTWGVGGGTTAAINVTTDFGSIGGTNSILRCRVSGGQSPLYFRQTASFTVRGWTVRDNKLSNFNNTPTSISTDASFDHWTTNTNTDTSAAVYPLGGADIP
jgi:hypothetical protein